MEKVLSIHPVTLCEVAKWELITTVPPLYFRPHQGNNKVVWIIANMKQGA